MPSQVLSLRLSPDNPHERAALEYLAQEMDAGRSIREVVADALVLAASQNLQTAQLVANTQSMARQQEQMLRMLETLQKREVAAVAQEDDSSNGNESGPPLSDGMRKMLGSQRRKLVTASDSHQ